VPAPSQLFLSTLRASRAARVSVRHRHAKAVAGTPVRRHAAGRRLDPAKASEVIASVRIVASTSPSTSRETPWPPWLPTVLTGFFVAATALSGTQVGTTEGTAQTVWVAAQVVSARRGGVGTERAHRVATRHERGTRPRGSPDRTYRHCGGRAGARCVAGAGHPFRSHRGHAGHRSRSDASLLVRTRIGTTPPAAAGGLGGAGGASADGIRDRHTPGRRGVGDDRAR